jgi:hypothetical protein
MNWKARYYGIRGRCGYVHAACLLEFQAANTRYDAQGRAVSTPEVDSMLDGLGHAIAGNCLHCGHPLAIDYSSRAERESLTLASDPTLLRQRLQEALGVLTDRRQFGKGRFDFTNRRLIGANGLALQWLTRPEPDQPENYRNQQTTRGAVILVCPKETSPA